MKYFFSVILIFIPLIACSSSTDDTYSEVETNQINNTVEENSSEDKLDSVYHYVRAHRYLDLKNLKSAEIRFQKVLDLEPNFARAWLGMANVAFLKGDFDESYEFAEEAVQLKPDLIEGIYIKALIHKEQKKCSKALKIVNKLEDYSFPPLLSISAFCNGIIENFEQANELFKIAYSSNENIDLTYLLEAEYQFYLGNFDQASDILDLYFSNYEGPGAYILKGKILIEKGDLTDAIGYFNEAKEMSSEPKIPLYYDKARLLIEKYEN